MSKLDAVDTAQKATCRVRDITVGLLGGIALSIVLQSPVADPARAQDASLIPSVDAEIDAILQAVGSVAVDAELTAIGVAQLRNQVRRLERRVAALERPGSP